MKENQHQILVVDDDQEILTVLEEFLRSCGYKVLVAGNGKEALDLLGQHKVDLIISDLIMPEIKGIELLERSKKMYPDTGFIIITAYGTINLAVEAMQKGAFDFVTKPFSFPNIDKSIKRYFEHQSLRRENQYLKNQLSLHYSQKKLIGQSEAMQRIFSHINVVARSDATVFIRGESGTGKELIARAIHFASDRADKPFLKVNCAAVPETLFESTFFGHQKGAFSGAHQTKKGIFEEADGGTLLLDEISEIPFSLQAKLLRVLQEMTIIRVGGTVEIPVNVRIIATSNRNMTELIEEGKFRQDLFYRLNIFPIEVPPLRERKEDIPLLVDHFLTVFSKKYKYKKKKITKEALNQLIEYDWPGNIRQMENILERAVLLSGPDDSIASKHLLFELDPAQRVSDDDNFNGGLLTLKEMEEKMIKAALQKTGYHREKAASLLGISVRTLRNKLKVYKMGN